MQLENGKTYITRQGYKITIRKLDTSQGDARYPFIGNNGFTFTDTGRWTIYNKHDNDLISEYKPVVM